ncbi:MAG: hypothetical protein GX132_05255 [Erysipelotrichia bacterium]|jgi:hypothetical protein|nr:hypothetical protein [Erysipelotrichia bacterium]
MTTTMSTEQVHQAAEYFKITANDLYYSLAEKKKIHILASNPEYNVIKASQPIETKIYTTQFENPFTLLIIILLAFVLTTIIAFFLSKASGFWLFILFVIPITGYQLYKTEFGVTKTFIVNYLDDIYYKIEKPKNQYFVANLMLHFCVLSLVISSFILLVFKETPIDKNTETMLAFLLLSIVTYVVIILFTFLTHQTSIKEEIYDNEILPHTFSMVNFYMSLLPLSIGICVLHSNFKQYWYIVLILLFASLFSLVEYLLTTKKYSEYKLVYKEDDKEEIELFTNK